MSKSEVKDFILEAISLATYRDGSSGGVIRMVDITEEGNERHYFTHQEKTIR